MAAGNCGSCHNIAETVLFEPEGYTQETNYAFVGRGRGEYKPSSYQYTGHGLGSYEKESRPGQSRPGYCWYVCPCLSVFLVGLLAVAGVWAYTSSDYDCLEGNSGDWTSARRAWCCVTEGHGCPGSTSSSTITYDCIVSPTNWEGGWSDTKRAYCCHHHDTGCSEETHSAASAPSHAAPEQQRQQQQHHHHHHQHTHDCAHSHHDPIRSWSDQRTEWCCFHQGIACPSSTPHPWDCDAGYDRWRQEWSFSKKAWCCDHRDRGCPPGHTTTTPKPATGCDRKCSLGGYLSSCAEHMRWSASNYKFPSNPCVSAYTLVLTQCDVCKDCTLADVDCKAPVDKRDYDCHTDWDHGDWNKTWSEDHKDWCCKVIGRGCGKGGTPAPLAYDCDKEFDDWEKSWNRDKTLWCCQYAGRGCVAQDTAE